MPIESLKQVGQVIGTMSEALMLTSFGPVDQLQYARTHPQDVATSPPRGTLVALTLADRQSIEACFPGFRNGSILRTSYERNPQNYIPSPQVRNAILFHGYSDMTTLATHVNDRVTQLCHTFSIKEGPFGAAEETLREGNIHAIVDAMGILLAGTYRNTGEEAIAHIYRVVDDATTFVKNNMELYNRNDPSSVPHFRRDTAELFLMAAAAHDFVEGKTIVSHEGNKRVVRRGEVLSHFRGGQDVYMTLRIYEDEKVKADVPLPDPVTFDQNHYFLLALQALDSSQVPGHQATQFLDEIIIRERRRQWLPHVSDPRLLYFGIPYLAKWLDRRDNAWTSTFLYDKAMNRFIPRPVGKIVDKAQETLYGYGRIDEHMAYVMNKFDNISSMVTFLSQYEIHASMLDFDIIHKFNTLWAKLMLLGLTPDQIWHALSPENKTVALFAA